MATLNIGMKVGAQVFADAPNANGTHNIYTVPSNAFLVITSFFVNATAISGSTNCSFSIVGVFTRSVAATGSTSISYNQVDGIVTSPISGPQSIGNNILIAPPSSTIQVLLNGSFGRQGNVRGFLIQNTQ